MLPMDSVMTPPLDHSDDCQQCTADPAGRRAKTLSVVASFKLISYISVNDPQAEVRDMHLQLEAVVSTGTFGAVYQGTWRGIAVAVKTLVVANDPAEGQGWTHQQRGVLEAAISLSMAHPNIVSKLRPFAHAE